MNFNTVEKATINYDVLLESINSKIKNPYLHYNKSALAVDLGLSIQAITNRISLKNLAFAKVIMILNDKGMTLEEYAKEQGLRKLNFAFRECLYYHEKSGLEPKEYINVTYKDHGLK